jgi:predicted class III extradiol MEMO1 family dioxygenase
MTDSTRTAAAPAHPRLRYVEVVPFRHEGRTHYYLRDPQGIATEPLALNPQQFFLAAQLNGARPLGEMRAAFARAFGGILLADSDIEGFVRTLDERLYLDSPRFRDRYERIRDEYRRSEVRPAWLAGNAYEEDPAALRARLDGLYDHPDGAGRPDPAHPSLSVPPGGRLSAVLAPHIDLRVGGPCYTHPFRALAEHTDCDRFVILGIAHQGSSRFLTASSKDFETPLGRAETDREFLSRWADAAGEDPAADDWSHRTEHSVEFPLVFLQHAIDRPFRIVPVLCSSWPGTEGSDAGELDPGEPAGGAVVTAETLRRADPLIAGLAETLESDGERTVVILSVDLAHVGPKFGDAHRITLEEAERHRAADRRALETVERMDAPGFFDAMRSDLLARRVDACPAVLTWMALARGGDGKLLSYGQNVQEDTGSLVTYASMAFFAPASS